MINNASNLTVVDVREEQDEYCYDGPPPPPTGHIPGALNYPWSAGVLEDRYTELPLNGTILVVCRSGGRSALASDFLCTNGFTSVFNMTGGMLAWEGETVGCCYSDGECDDGLYCTGVETCIELNCQTGSGDPCPAPYECCDEIGDTCTAAPDDYDCDGIVDNQDNCLEVFNPGQEDTCPEGGNDLGDACECEGDFDCDSDVDGTDAMRFKEHFGRSQFNNPCIPDNPCYGDFECDDDVDGSDASILRDDFGRSGFADPCPACPSVQGCTY